MNDKVIKSISVYSVMKDMIAKADVMRGKFDAISAAYQRSASLMGLNDLPRKYARETVSIMDTDTVLKIDPMTQYSRATSDAVAYSLGMGYRKFPVIPKWIVDLNQPANNIVNQALATQKSWQRIMPIVPVGFSGYDISASAYRFKNLNMAAHSVADVMKVSGAIHRFDLSIKSIYALIADLKEYEGEFQIDIENELTAALTYDIEHAASDGNRISITYVAKCFLDTFSEMAENYRTGKDQKLFLKWITDYLDNLKSSGVRVGVIKFLVCVIPILFAVSEMLNEEKVSNTTYITEAAFGAVTKNIKLLKDKPDGRLKTKVIIPVGTKLTILQTKGKWIEVKFVANGNYYIGWTLNSGL